MALTREEKERLDRIMGIQERTPFVREEGTLLIFGEHATRDDADEVLAAIDGEQKRDRKVKRGEALNRVLAKMGGRR